MQYIKKSRIAPTNSKVEELRKIIVEDANGYACLLCTNWSRVTSNDLHSLMKAGLTFYNIIRAYSFFLSISRADLAIVLEMTIDENRREDE